MKMTNVSPKNIKIGDVNNIVGFRYIKLEITASNGDPITTIGDVNYIINGQSMPNVSMTDFTTGQFEVVDWSSYYNNDSLYEPWKAFDDLTGTDNRWLVDNVGPKFVTLDLGANYNLLNFTEVRILPGSHISNDWNARSIQDFKVLVSSDNIEYTEVLNETGVSNWQNGVEKVFTIS